ncbi:hypothetical protein KJ652_05695 [Patescibacteria group bacterium]|nr:hypothetical protein [Patescibacteria group bacterium]MBU1124055.1 hypothetical protein [Patescibacteria group bacterium]MBU1911025.1 hypothetical protein [Patescibacteria group bacterium]
MAQKRIWEAMPALARSGAEGKAKGAIKIKLAEKDKFYATGDESMMKEAGIPYDAALDLSKLFSRNDRVTGGIKTQDMDAETIFDFTRALEDVVDRYKTEEPDKGDNPFV